jgi:hypothetical protein
MFAGSNLNLWQQAEKRHPLCCQVGCLGNSPATIPIVQEIPTNEEHKQPHTIS